MQVTIPRVPTPHAVGEIETNSCQPLELVAHVAHIHHAQMIVRDGLIRPNLVYDESVLNSERILVCWISPNRWVYGYRYGSICFNFNFSPLIDGLRAYYVETMAAYRPPAVRILFSRKNYDGHRFLQPLDLQDRQCALWRNPEDDAFYWNGEICLELMIEGEIPTAMLASVEFVSHHRDMCSLRQGNCIEQRMHRFTAGARFFLGALLSGLNVGAINLNNESRQCIAKEVVAEVMWPRDGEIAYQGCLRNDDQTWPAIVRSFCRAYAAGDSDTATALLGMAPNSQVFREKLAEYLVPALGLTPDEYQRALT